MDRTRRIRASSVLGESRKEVPGVLCPEERKLTKN